MLRYIAFSVLVLSGFQLQGLSTHAAEPDLARMVGQGIDYLRAQQAEDGSFSSFAGTGVTSLVTTALIRNGVSLEDPLVAKAIEYLEDHARSNGGIYAEGSNHRNYETCLAVLCFSEANRNGEYDKLLKQADSFLKGLQWDDQEGHDASSTSYGGAGYGRHSRPDLSNTAFMIDALKALGNEANEAAIQRALVFVSRCQNLDTKYNDTEFASKNPDGGFYYTVAAGGSSQAGETPEGGLRSYGSMTYAGLKSMIYAGVAKDDPRVAAAKKWITENYTLEENPYMSDNGLYYYYHTFAKTLNALGEPTIVDAEGDEHNWREELIAALAKRQQKNGSWTNANERWLEGDANLVTGYVLLTLSYVRE